jgi:hypothetical protein
MYVLRTIQIILDNKIDFCRKIADLAIFVFSDQPEHRFNIETSTFQTGPKFGLMRTTVTLEIGPHKFSKRTVRKNLVYFQCTGCKSMKFNLLAKAQKLSECDYRLVDWPDFEHHVCTASK